MRKPRAVIINETPEGKKSLIKLLRGVVKDGGRERVKTERGVEEDDIEASGLDYHIIAAENVTHSIRSNSRLRKGNIYFIREDPKNPKLASQIAKELINRGVNAGMVLTTDRPSPYAETMREPGHEYFSGWLPKTEERFDAGEVSRKIKELRKDHKMVQPISLGIIGLGKLGRQLCSDLKSKPYASSIHAFTNWAKDSYERDIKPRLAFKGDQESKFEFHKRLEAVIEANPDILIVATGEHGIPYDEYGAIKDLTGRLMQGAYPKVRNTLQAIKDRNYQGTICMEANPTGPLLQVAKRMGVDPSNLTSITPDMSRHKTLLLKRLSKKDPSLIYSDIDLTVIGEHGKEIPLLREATVRGKPLPEAHPKFKNPFYRKDFIREAREIGLNLVKVAERLGDNYGGIPEIIIENLEGFAYFQRNIPSAYSYFAEADCFIGAPSIVSYPLKIESEGEKLRDLSQDKEVRAELGRTLAYQRALADKYHPKTK